ncbi:uncharacterized protein LOC125495894 isoform X2 [Beta vulgaris subsp. vulgaris]|uniref:uncharacterized protein LOC125495894 isoform X2 n=1 Tax=Beta vulgaris subsp. vulgaris TaxID=3555 RepID=UPI002036DCA9|nr:uncharacterized protein LOC125495894 isoform X2 [Beta vulgaris subsp. vulgaris]
MAINSHVNVASLKLPHTTHHHSIFHHLHSTGKLPGNRYPKTPLRTPVFFRNPLSYPSAFVQPPQHHHPPPTSITTTTCDVACFCANQQPPHRQPSRVPSPSLSFLSLFLAQFALSLSYAWSAARTAQHHGPPSCLTFCLASPISRRASSFFYCSLVRRCLVEAEIKRKGYYSLPRPSRLLSKNPDYEYKEQNGQ